MKSEQWVKVRESEEAIEDGLDAGWTEAEI